MLLIPKTILLSKIAFIVAVTLLLPSYSFAEDSSPKNGSRSLLNSSLDFLRQKIKESGYGISEQDLNRIKRQGNTFFIPKDLRLKALANLPVIQEEIGVRKTVFKSTDLNLPGPPSKVTLFQLTKLNSKSLISALGLRANDTIFKVNDEIIQNADEATRIFNKLKLSNQINISILRNQKLIKFLYKIE